MKRVFLLFVLFLSLISCFAQKTQKENLWNGTGKFILGTDKSAFSTTIELAKGGADTFSIKKSYTYNYLPSQDTPFVFAGVKFRNISLTFNEAGKLIGYDLSAIFIETDTTDYFNDAGVAIKNIAGYLSKTLKEDGTLTYQNDNKYTTSYSYQWRIKHKRITAATHLGKANQFRRNMIILIVALWGDD